jgi:Tfp pilus assembly protein PilN
MNNLNLMSETQKDALYSRVVYAMIERLLIFLAAVILIASVALLFVEVRLNQNLSLTLARQTLSAEYRSINKRVGELNDLITRIEATQKKIYPASTVLIDVAGRTPAGVTVTAMDFETKTNSMRLSGVADTRASLLKFEEALKQSPFIKTLESPISNLFQKSNIVFRFQAVLNVEPIKKVLEP